jgi:protein TonB
VNDARGELPGVATDKAGSGGDRSGFAAFQDEHLARHWMAPLATSTSIYAAVITVVVMVGSVTKHVVQEKQIDVTFVEKILKEEPPAPAPPAPAPIARPEPPAAMAPVVRPDQKIRKLDKPPPRKELVAPKAVPQEAPKEAEPAEDRGIAVFGEPGQEDPAGLEGGVARGGTLGGEVGGAIAVPDGATPPIPLASNKEPPYPRGAQRRGQTGNVVVKLTILADGSVAKVEVVQGEEPFVSSAVETVKTWRFKPARFKGQPISVFKLYRVTFKLDT